jgi:hypothetical protein
MRCPTTVAFGAGAPARRAVRARRRKEAGTLCDQLIPIGFTATVRRGVAPFPLEPWERACSHTPTRLLPPLGG